MPISFSSLISAITSLYSHHWRFRITRDYCQTRPTAYTAAVSRYTCNTAAYVAERPSGPGGGQFDVASMCHPLYKPPSRCYGSLLPSLTRQNHPRLLPNSPYSVHGSRFPIHMQYCRIYTNVDKWPMSQWFLVNSWRTSHMQLNCCTCLMYRIIHYSIIVLLHSDSFLKSTKRKNDDIGQVRIHTKFEEISSITSPSASRTGSPFRCIWSKDQSVWSSKRKREKRAPARFSRSCSDGKSII